MQVIHHTARFHECFFYFFFFSPALPLGLALLGLAGEEGLRATVFHDSQIQGGSRSPLMGRLHTVTRCAALHFKTRARWWLERQSQPASQPDNSLPTRSSRPTRYCPWLVTSEAAQHGCTNAGSQGKEC
jgi:hypothetical protein